MLFQFQSSEKPDFDNFFSALNSSLEEKIFRVLTPGRTSQGGNLYSDNNCKYFFLITMLLFYFWKSKYS